MRAFFLSFLFLDRIDAMEENLIEIVSKNLSSLRKGRGLTQGEIAERFSYSDKSISKWERGEALPDLSVLKAFADFYEVSLDYLVTSHSEESVKEKATCPPKKVLRERITLILIGVCSLISIFCIVEAVFRINPVGDWKSFETYFWLPVALFLLLFLFGKRYGWAPLRYIGIFGFILFASLATYLELGYDLGAKGWDCWFVLLTPIPLILSILLAKGLDKGKKNN